MLKEKHMESGTSKKENVLILSASHPFKKSGIVATDLMNCLIDVGYNVQIITNKKIDKKYENVSSITSPVKHEYKRIKNKLIRLTQRKKVSDTNYYMYSLDASKSSVNAKKIVKKTTIKPDVFIVLFPNNFLNADDLYYLNKKTDALVFWYMMDMAPLTGGCHYAWNCIGYTKECGCCPGIDSKDKNDQTHLNMLNKINLIEKSNIIPIACNEWQFRQLKASSVFKSKRHYKVHLPINNNIFKPSNKLAARTHFKLPSEKKLIFFGAVSITESRKGYKELIESLEILKHQLEESEINNIQLIIAGNDNERLTKDLPFNHSFLGYLDYNDLATAFQAADVFVCPSIEDSGPMMINQSIMCGTPVVAFEMGAAIDFVQNGKTGFRAKLGDCNELAVGLKDTILMNITTKENMDLNCVEMSLNLLQTQQIAAQFKTIINEI